MFCMTMVELLFSPLKLLFIVQSPPFLVSPGIFSVSKVTPRPRYLSFDRGFRSRLHVTRVHQGNMSKNVGRSRVGYSERKPRAQGTEMGVKQRVGRSCGCFQDTKTAEKLIS